jgi:conjugative transposon TraM protein
MKTILRKRKFYLVLPLLALPFVTLAFWALGGGKTSDEVKPATGLNLQLPDAKLKDDKNLDKLSFYNQADRDSAKREEALRNDPNFRVQPDTAMNVLQMIPQTSVVGNVDANEKKIYSKINELNTQINQPNKSSTEYSPEISNTINKDFSGQVDKLQNMMKVMTEKNGSDSETIQLSGMMDKILDIQHPERVKEKIKEKSITNKTQVFAVESSVPDNNISLMQSQKLRDHNSFYDDNSTASDSIGNAIEAVVHETQIIVTGSTVKLRLTTNIYINGILIPKGNFIYGTASLENERLAIIISSVRYQNNLLPVALQVYDMDGLSGIYIPGSISRDVAKESAEKSLQGIDVTTLDPSVAAQVTGAGITAAKNLLSKKAKLVKVTLKAGYKILLKDNNKN